MMSRNLGLAAVAFWFVLMTAAAVSLVTIPVASSAQVRDILDADGRIDLFAEVWCLSLDYGSDDVLDTNGCDHVFTG